MAKKYETAVIKYVGAGRYAVYFINTSHEVLSDSKYLYDIIGSMNNEGYFVSCAEKMGTENVVVVMTKEV